jgi:opacity protein-like surface antigen
MNPMRILKLKICLAFFTVLSLFVFSLTVQAQAAPCCPPPCPPCGYSTGNFANLPSDACGVNPLINYMATAECCYNRGYFGGFNFGAAYGVGAVHHQLAAAERRPFAGDSRRRSRSYLVGIFDVGYNLVYNYFFLGAEAGYDIRSRSDPVNLLDFDDSLRTFVVLDDSLIRRPEVISAPCRIRLDINSRHAVTGDLLPGFVICRFVMYLRLGIEKSHFVFDERVCFPQVVVNESPFVKVAPGTGAIVPPHTVFVRPQDFFTSFKNSTTGFRLGAGIGFAVTQNVSFHLNYIHTFSQRLTFNIDLAPIQNIAPVVFDKTGSVPPVVVSEALLSFLASGITINPQRDEVNFGVKFRL